jgi:hypothetical protein
MMMQQPHEKQGTGMPRRGSGAVIAFRCPNGHVIRVPAHLAGKKGRCPHCKTPMTIPVPPGSSQGVNPPNVNPLDDNPLNDDLLVGNPLAADPREPDSLDDLVSAEGGSLEEIPLLEAEPVALQAEAVPMESPAQRVEVDDAPWHPTADLVARLWAEREHGGHVEVHHAEGVIVPDWYDVTWSRGTHGVFGSQAPDGTVTITAVAWSAVQRVLVRQVQTLPADMFPTG